MLKDVISYSDAWRRITDASSTSRAILAFVNFIEKRLGAEFVYDLARIRYEPLTLVPLLNLAEKLRALGVIQSYGRKRSGISGFPDEPKVSHWYAKYATSTDAYNWSGGSSLEHDELALVKTLAEAIERNAWYRHDTFPRIRSASINDLKDSDDFLYPQSFVGFTKHQRDTISRLRFDSNTSFKWVRGHSWTRNRPVWVPAQIVSGKEGLKAFSKSSHEPVIRTSITTGLATHPNRKSALLLGAFECIERDAFMITWLNQLTPPRVDIHSLCTQHDVLARLVAKCRQYRLEPYAIYLPTDAPAYAIAVVLEDMTGSLPRFSVAMKSGRALGSTIEGALLEALRIRISTRDMMLSQDNWDKDRQASDIGHLDRFLYWTEYNRAEQLMFLIKGDVRTTQNEAWEQYDDETHFSRIVEWCMQKHYELTSVDFTDAIANVPNWHIEFVVIPELQPLHLSERYPYTGGARLHDIPKLFGYSSREPYLKHPHPFA